MLAEIAAHKKNETERKQIALPLEHLQEKVTSSRPVRDFKSALKQDGVSLIAEVKKKSPSKGLLKNDFNHLEVARFYAGSGAAAISVLGDEHFFAGGSEIVNTISCDNNITLPVMFKDFIASEYQVYEARAANADALLLIVRIMDQPTLEHLIAKTRQLGMSALVEAFDEQDVRRALEAGADIIGINNRDLDTFKTNFAKTERLARLIPADIVTVSESGIHTRDDVDFMASIGFNAMLVGEAILAEQNMQMKINELLRK